MTLRKALQKGLFPRELLEGWCAKEGKTTPAQILRRDWLSRVTIIAGFYGVLVGTLVIVACQWLLRDSFWLWPVIILVGGLMLAVMVITIVVNNDIQSKPHQRLRRDLEQLHGALDDQLNNPMLIWRSICSLRSAIGEVLTDLARQIYLVELRMREGTVTANIVKASHQWENLKEKFGQTYQLGLKFGLIILPTSHFYRQAWFELTDEIRGALTKLKIRVE